MTLSDKMSQFCIKISDWFSHPIAIIALPLACISYLQLGGEEGRLTLILSVLAISLTQMVLNAQSVDMEQTKLQIAELVIATPKARNEVTKKDMTKGELRHLEEGIKDAVTTT